MLGSSASPIVGNASASTTKGAQVLRAVRGDEEEMIRLCKQQSLIRTRQTGCRGVSWLRPLLLAVAMTTVRGEATCQDGAMSVVDWSVSENAERVYGWVEDEPDSEFSDIVGVALGTGGSIAVADRRLATITVFSVDGTVIATMGREGDGPGEFRNLAGIVAHGEDRFVVFDRAHQRLSEWRSDGTLVGDRSLRRGDTERRIGTVGRFVNGSWYAAEGDQLIPARVGDTAQDTVGFYRLDDNATVGEVLARVPGSLSTQFIIQGMPGNRMALLSPRRVGQVRGNCLLVGTTDDPILTLVNRSGEVHGQVPLEISVERATEEHRRTWVATTLAATARQFGAEVPPEQTRMLTAMAEAAGMAEQIPFAHELIVDELGYVWAQRYEMPDGPGGLEWWVFSETGRFLGSVHLPGRLRVLRISMDAIVGVWTDELGLQYVHAYSLDRRGEIARRPLPTGCF